MTKRIISVFTVLAVLFLSAVNALGAQTDSGAFYSSMACSTAKDMKIEKTTTNLAALEITTERIIADTNIDKQFPVTGKPVMLMTAFTASMLVNANEITVPAQCITDPKNNVLGLKAGIAVNVNDLIAAVLLYDDVNAAQTLAVGVSGSVDSFIVQMNKTARRYSMKNTAFTNVTGKQDVKQVSTAGDIATLVYISYLRTSLVDITSAHTYYIRSSSLASSLKTLENPFLMINSSSEYYNHNVFGIGVSESSGDYSEMMLLYSTSQEKYIIVLRTKTSSAYKDGADALDYIGQNYILADISKIIFELGDDLTVKLGGEDVHFSVVKNSVKNTNVIVNKFYSRSVMTTNEKYTIEPPEQLPATVRVGDVVAGFRVIYNGAYITTMSMAVKHVGEEVEKTTSQRYTVYEKGTVNTEQSFIKKHSWIFTLLVAFGLGLGVIIIVTRIKKI